MRQSTSRLLMVRPAAFGFNPDTEDSNSFQSKDLNFSQKDINAEALAEFDAFVKKLRQNHVEVTVIDDTSIPTKPDALFPNNWISMNHTGEITLFPMAAPNRRLERRVDILEMLARDFEVHQTVDLSSNESEGKFLEGTGSIVFDHLFRVAFACTSERTDPELFEKFCESINYTPLLFHAFDKDKKAIYHTNVMMCIGTYVAVICGESIKDQKEREQIFHKLESTGHEIIDISLEQMNQFAGNMLEVANTKGEKLLVMSTQAFKSLKKDQVDLLDRHVGIVHSPLYTIEKTGGGSARCMMAEIFLQPKNKR